MNQKKIPKWLYSILLIVFLISLITYFKIAEVPRWDGLFISIAGTILGILVTIGFIDIIAYRYNKRQWSPVENKIKDSLIDILLIVYNFIYLNYAALEKWIEVYNDHKISRKNKLKNLGEYITQQSINKNYLNEIAKDSHLLEFYFTGYKGVQNSLRDFWQLYHLRLTYQESPLFMDIQSGLSKVIHDIQLVINLKGAIEISGLSLNINNLNSSLDQYSKDLDVVSTSVVDLSKLLINKKE
jgi:hypothetical protein